jgi:hypothetical protein
MDAAVGCHGVGKLFLRIAPGHGMLQLSFFATLHCDVISS